MGLVNPELLLDGAEADGVLFIECMSFTGEEGQGLDEAERAAAGAIRRVSYEHRHLVDVCRRQEMGDAELGKPRGHSELRHPLPPPKVEWKDFPSRMAAFDALTATDGRIVLIGDSGMGKSELALQAARRFDAGIGWFVPAATTSALQAGLASRELFERDQSPPVLSAEDRGYYAKAARARLDGTKEPWVVVFDNADGKPESVLGWLPRPEGRQRVIVDDDEPGVARRAGIHCG